MAKHKIKATLTGYFEVDDKDLAAYEAETIAQAMGNQLSWLEDEGDIMSFVADTVENPELRLEILS